MVPENASLFVWMTIALLVSWACVVAIFLGTVVLYLYGQVPRNADPALLCLYVERGEWVEGHGCILQEI